MRKTINRLPDDLSSYYYLQAIEKLREAVIYLDLDYKILGWNNAATQLYGYSQKEAIGASGREILKTEFSFGGKDIWKDSLFNKGHWEGEVMHRRKNGEAFAVWSSSTLIKDKTGKAIGILAVNMDISKRKMYEASLEQERNKIAAIIESTSDSIIGLDRDVNCIYVNSAALKLLGFSEDEIIGKNAHDLIHYKFLDGTPYPIVQCPFYRSLVDGKASGIIEEVVWRKDGTPIDVLCSCSPVFENGRITGGVIAMLDATERKKSQEELVTYKERLEEAQTAGGIGIFDWNVQTGKIWWSETQEKLFGFQPGTYQGTLGAWNKVLHPKDAKRVNQEVRQSVAENKDLSTEFRIRLADGSIKWIKGKAHVYSDKNGRVLKMVGVNYDITSRKKNEEELIYYRILNQNIGDAVISTDNNFIIRSWNKGATNLYGYEEPEMIGTRLFGLIKTKYPSSTSRAKVFKILRKEGSWSGELQQTTKDGITKWVNRTVNEVCNEEGKRLGWVSVSHDITEQKRIENILTFKAEASKILSTSLEYTKTIKNVAKIAVPDFADWCAVEMINEHNEIVQVAIEHKDPLMIKWAKKHRKENPPKLDEPHGIPEVIRTGKIAYYPYIDDQLLKSSSATKRQYDLVKKVGLTSVIIVPINVRKKTVGAISFVTTTSKRRFSDIDYQVAEQIGTRASMAIENSILYQEVESERERLSTIVSNVPGVVWEAWGRPDTNKQKINFVSFYVEKLLGYSVEEWLSKPGFWLSIVHPEDKERAVREAIAIFESGKRGISRFRWIKKDGSVVWAESQSFVIKDNRGRSVGMRGVTMDISERMEIERRKDEFISIASHELKTPITSLKVYNHVLKNNMVKQKNGVLMGHLEKMDKQIDRLTQLISDLLDVSKVQTGNLELRLEDFSLDKLVEEAVENMEAATPTHKIEIQGSFDISLYGDRERIEQVLINLLSNAVKYSPHSNKIVVKLKKFDHHAEVRVKDFGIGIEKEHLKKLFQRFYRVYDNQDKTFPGLGIGLYISSEIIRRHGGEMGVKSEKGKGSTFYFRLPYKKQND